MTAVQVNRTGAGDCYFNGGYVNASYMITGEHLGYDRATGYDDRLIPFRNIGSYKDGKRGWGAWQLAARFSWIDLNSTASAAAGWRTRPSASTGTSARISA